MIPAPRKPDPRGGLCGCATTRRHCSPPPPRGHRQQLPGSRGRGGGKAPLGAAHALCAGPRGAGREGSRPPFPGWVAVVAPCRALWFPSATSRTWRRLATSSARTAARAAPRSAKRAVSPLRRAGGAGGPPRPGPVRPGPARRGACGGGGWWGFSPRPPRGSVR